MPMEYKIALSGPSGLGKTTLCKFIEKEFGVTHLSTSAGDILPQSEKDYMFRAFGYRGTGHKDVINLSAVEPMFGSHFQKAVLNSRVSQIVRNESFVIDRTPIDNVVYALSQVSHNETESFIKSFINQAQAAFEGLTHVIQIRYSPDIPGIEDNKSRVPNIYYQRYISDVFSGVYSRYFANLEGPRVITIDFWDLNSRKELVKAFLAHDTKGL